MGPQLDSCGRAGWDNFTPKEYRLQWGRNLTVAEGLSLEVADGAGAWLQWGRNLTVAEGGASGVGRSTTYRLQWGRNLTVAEGKAPAGDHGHTVGLQWGRNLTVAEGSRIACLCAFRRHASMGPQLDSCGRRVADSALAALTPCFNGAAT